MRGLWRVLLCASLEAVTACGGQTEGDANNGDASPGRAPGSGSAADASVTEPPRSRPDGGLVPSLETGPVPAVDGAGSTLNPRDVGVDAPVVPTVDGAMSRPPDGARDVAADRYVDAPSDGHAGRDSGCAEDVCTPACSCASDSACNLCQTATCSDSVKNGSESDVDCGGAECLSCGLGQYCLVDADCYTSDCYLGVCRIPHCWDFERNGTETDVDCGGPVCAPCFVGQGCELPTDCASAVCTNSTCATPTCVDGVRNGGESGVDCGGSCPPCP